MNKKLIALAVASTFTVPAMVQAEDAPANWYGRVNTAIAFKDTKGGSTVVDIKNISSRFGVRGSSDLGNGRSVVYRYEFGVASDIADIQDNNRLSFVGLKGEFGTVTMGRVWSAYFNHVGTLMDLSQNIGGDAYTAGGGTYRTSNTLSYSGGAGPISFQADVEMDGGNVASSGADSWALAGTFKTGSLAIAAAYRDVAGSRRTEPASADSESAGVAFRVDLEGFHIGAGFTTQDDGSADDRTGWALTGGGKLGEAVWWATYEDMQDDDTGLDDSAINLHLGRDLGKGTLVYTEIALNDAGSAGNDSTEVLLGLRKNF